MSGHYVEREIKIVEVTYVRDNVTHTTYELRAYNSDNEEDYEVLESSVYLFRIFQ